MTKKAFSGVPTILRFLSHPAVLLAIMLPGMGHFFAAPALAQKPPLKLIRVVMDDSYPPYVFRGPDGKLQGVLVDQWRLWEKKTGIRAQLSAMDWAQAQRRMQNGEFHVVDAIFRNDNRERIYQFSRPFARLDVPLYFRCDIAGIGSVDDLKGFAVGAKEGGNAVDVLRAHGITNIVLYKSFEALVTAARDRKVNVFTLDRVPAMYYLCKLGIAQQFRETKPLYRGDLHRAVLKEKGDLMQIVDSGFALISKAEEQEIQRRWMGSPIITSSQWHSLEVTAFAIVAMVGMLFLWLWALKRTVHQRTARLEQEIAARIQQEEELRESEERMRLFFERQLVGMAIISTDMEWLKVNEKLCLMLGYTLEELHQLTWAEVTHPDDLSKDYELYQRLLAGAIDDYSLEKRYLRKEGSVVYGNLSIGCVRRADGSVKYILALVEDLTARRRAEHELEVKSFTIENLADAVYWIGADGRFWDVNAVACRTLGFTREELLSLSVADIDPNYPAELWPSTWRKVKHTECLHFETLHRTKDGRLFPVEITANYFKFNDLEYSCAIVRDVSEQRRAEQEKQMLMSQLSQSQRMESIGRLAGGIAHDFNNLLTPIIVYADLLQRGKPAGSQEYKQINTIMLAADKAKLLTQQLLSFGRKQILEMKPVDLNEVVSSFYDILRRTIRENIEIRLHLTPDRYAIRADSNQLEQIIMNLVINAQDAIEGKGLITLETAPIELDEEYARQHAGVNPGKYLMLAVTDNGRGMSRETLSHLFEPFFTTKAVGEGSGLGLAMVYGLVKQHGGNIWVYSEMGQGSAFKIYFPILEQAPPVRPDRHDEEKVLNVGHETVLLVEDNELVRTLTRDLLESNGFTVLMPEGPRQALELARGKEIDLLVTDVVMPEWNGPELHRRLLKTHPGLKVLFMSGYTNNVIAKHGVLEEGINFIQKPFTLQEMARKIDLVLNRPHPF